MLRILVILILLTTVAIAMVMLARRRGIKELSTQETRPSPPVRDRPAGPGAESMRADEAGGHRSE